MTWTTYRVSGLMAAILAGGLAALFLVAANGASAGSSGPKPQRCFGEKATVNGIVGTPGNDVIVGTNDADQIDGKGGKDRICGRKGPDELRGGTGNDIIHGGAGRDLILGEEGADRLFGNGGMDGDFRPPRECEIIFDRAQRGPFGCCILLRDAADDGSSERGIFPCCLPRDSAAGDGSGERGFCPFRGKEPNTGIFGGPGKDVLGGGNGNDSLFGEEGQDIHRGATGYDTCLDGPDSTVRSCEGGNEF